MKKLAILVLVLLFFTNHSKSQEYQQAIGLRAGFFNGITYKHFIKDDAALEFIGYTRWRGFEAVGLYELHKYGIFDVQRLNLYYGGGLHVGFWDNRYHPWAKFNTGNNFGLGVDGILGVEYNIKEIPLNISLDWKPYANLIGYRNFGPDGGALSIRYLIR